MEMGRLGLFPWRGDPEISCCGSNVTQLPIMTRAFSSFYVLYWNFEGLCKCFALKIVSFVGPVNIWWPRGPTFAVGMISSGIQKQRYCPEINGEALHVVKGGGGGGADRDKHGA